MRDDGETIMSEHPTPLDTELRSLVGEQGQGSSHRDPALLQQSTEDHAMPPGLPAPEEPAMSVDVGSVLSAGDDTEQESASLYGSLLEGRPQGEAAEDSGEGCGRARAAGADKPSGVAGAPLSLRSLGITQSLLPNQHPLPPEEGGGSGDVEDARGLDLRCHSKNVLVFSSAGKPVFSLHGDENELAGLMAAAQAIISVVQRSGEQLKHLRAGHHVIAFLDRSPLYLVASSALGEPPAVLRMQLSLVHGQLASLLTTSAMASLFRRSPGYDLRRLLCGTENMLRQLIAGFSSSPASALGAFASLPLAPPIRTMVSGALAAAVRESASMFGLVLGGGHVVSLAAPPASPLQAWDVLLLQNFLLSSPTFLAAEAFTPYCLLHYNPSANLHAYVHFMDAPTRTAVVLLSGSPPEFHALSAARRQMQASLEAAGTLEALLAAVAAAGSTDSSPLSLSTALPKQIGGGPVGTTSLLHFAYRLSGRQQFVMSPFAEPLDDPSLRQAVVVAYGQLRAAMFDAAGERVGGSGGGSTGPLQKLRFEARRRFCLLASASNEAELYLTLDPLADKVAAVGLHDRLAAWLRARHDELFL